MSLSISEIIKHPNELFSESTLCSALNKSNAWAQRHRWAGTGIPYIKVGRSVRYRGADVAAWLDSRRVEVHGS